MPQLKLLLPHQLPIRGLSQEKLKKFQTNLEVWIGEDEDLAIFLITGIYNTWEPAETNPNKIGAGLDAYPELNVNPELPNLKRYWANLLDKR